MNKYLLIFLTVLPLVFFNGCKKKSEKLTISGKVTEPIQGGELNGVYVYLSAQRMENGAWSSNFSFIASTNTDSNGEFTLEFDKETVSQYKLEFSKDQYIDNIALFYQDDLGTDENYSTYNLYAKSYLKLNLYNQYPIDSADQLKYRINGVFTCAECCSDQFRIYTGTNINESKTCIVPGYQDVEVEWQVTKNSTPTEYSQTIYIKEFETTEFTIAY